MKFKLSLSLALLSIMVLSALCSAQVEAPVMILEADGRAALPAAFRSSQDALPESPDAPSTRGLVEINASASDQFSQTQFRQMLRRLPHNLVVVDLRAKPHGYVNGLAVGWSGDAPDASLNLADWLESEETSRLLAAQETGRILMTTAKREESAGAPATPVPLQVLSAQSEAQLMALSGLGYFRLPLGGMPPGDQQLEEFLRLRGNLAPGTWLHFHGGVNDEIPSLMLLLQDILENAKQVELADMVARQAVLAGGIAFLQTPGKPEASDQSGGMAQFLANFHQFARENEKGRQVSWLDWLRRQEAANPPEATLGR